MVCKAADFTGQHLQGAKWLNWSGDVEFAPADYWEPAHSDGTAIDGLTSLVHAVVEAGEAGQSIHAIGSGWAFEDAAASDGAVVSLRQLDRQLDYVVGGAAPALTPTWQGQQTDSHSTTVLLHVEAGIRIATLSALLRSQGLAMPTLGGSNGQSLAGAISTSTHGGDWNQPPFPDLVRAIHLVGDDGKERWIEPASGAITRSDDDNAELRGALPCGDTEIVRDDRVFRAALVACGRFGIFYSLVLEVRRAFRVVEVVNTPSRAEVLQALRDGVAQGTVLTPFFDLLAPLPIPAGIDDAMGTPYFVQVLFNSQNPENLWVHRRWETEVAASIPDDNVITGEVDTDGLVAVGLIPVINGALGAAALLEGPGVALYLTLFVIPEFNAKMVGHPLTLGYVVAAGLDALWKDPLASQTIPQLNGSVIGGRMGDAMGHGRRGPHYLLTSGTREDSDSTSFRSVSIELVFDATKPGYLDFLDEILPVAPRFQQAGYVSLRPSKASEAYLSMHAVGGSHAMSIEIASLQGLAGNEGWIGYVERRAIAHGGRPHWGQQNTLDALDVARLYGPALEHWREALLSHSGTSTRFSNAFTQARGLEPVAIAREVTGTRKPTGTITHLCNADAAWSPVPVGQAIRDIESGTVRYFVRNDDRFVLVRVVDGRYLRTEPDDTATDNLDKLPGC
jgi:hypothetical protein